MPEITLPLTVRELTPADLRPRMFGWSATHLQSIRVSLDRAARGEVDYLAVCGPAGPPIAVGGVDYARPTGVPEIWQLEVDAALRSVGIGTILIGALEQCALARGHRVAALGVDVNWAGPQVLYERLGYVVNGQETDGWDTEDEHGVVTRYETTITRLQKTLR